MPYHTSSLRAPAASVCRLGCGAPRKIDVARRGRSRFDGDGGGGGAGGAVASPPSARRVGTISGGSSGGARALRFVDVW